MKAKLLIILFVILHNVIYSQQNISTMEEFSNTGWKSLDQNIIQLIGHEWMLISAGSTNQGFNMMTASWGGMGWLWEKPVAFIFVRPQRYTHEFTEREDYFTLTFFDKEFKDILLKMGTVSGRDFDKVHQSGLTPIETENGSIAFREARIVVECKKVYKTIIQENEFSDVALSHKIYPNKDYHSMYIGEIVNVWMKKD